MKLYVKFLKFILSFLILCSSIIFSKDLYIGGYWEAPPAFNYNPYTVGGTTSLIPFIYSPLFYYIPSDNTFIPCLAESFFKKDNKYTVILRKNTYWTDNHLITSKDILAILTIGVLINLYPPLIDIKIIDNSKIEVTFCRRLTKSEEVRFLTAPINTPYHIYKDIVDSSVDFINTYKDYLIFQDYKYNFFLYNKSSENDYKVLNFDLKEREKSYYKDRKNILVKLYSYKPVFVGNGMFVIDKISFSEALLIKNKNFFKEILIDRIKAIRWSSNEAVWASLIMGELDVSHVATPFDVTNRITQLNKDIKILYFSDYKEFGIAFNLRKKPFSNINFRKAINYIINKDEIRKISNFYSQTTYYTTGIIYSQFENYVGNLSLERYNWDLVKAKKLLKDAGYTVNKNGFYIDSEGKLIEIEILVEAGYSDWIVAAEIISSQLNKVGIKAKVRIVESTLFNDLVLNGKFDIFCRFLVDMYLTPEDSLKLIYFSNSFFNKSISIPENLVSFNNRSYFLQDLLIRYFQGDKEALRHLIWITNNYLPFISIYEKRMVLFVNYKRLHWDIPYNYLSLAPKGIENFYSLLIYQHKVK